MAALAVAVLTLVALCAAVVVTARGATEAAHAEVAPRQLINRLWLDRYPDKPRDVVNLFIFFGSGFGVHEHGSRWRATIDFFEFERQGDSVELTFFHDKRRHKTSFKIVDCKDERHFDICLDFDSSPRGPSRYYSWGDDDEDEARLPWAASWKRAAEERARRAAVAAHEADGE